MCPLLESRHGARRRGADPLGIALAAAQRSVAGIDAQIKIPASNYYP